MIPTRIGQLVDSCTFAGLHQVKNCIYAILLAPKETEVSVPFGDIEDIHTTTSVIDGYTTTSKFNSPEYFAPHYCKSLTLDGCNDFYLPSITELFICYKTLSQQRYSLYSDMTSLAVQKSAFLFNALENSDHTPTLILRFSVGDQQFASTNFYQSSTLNTGLVHYTSLPYVCAIDFDDGQMIAEDHYNELLVRPVRRIQVIE